MVAHDQDVCNLDARNSVAAADNLKMNAYDMVFVLCCADKSGAVGRLIGICFSLKRCDFLFNNSTRNC
jgi:hypothetical protein